MAKTYYEVLGVSKSASADEIRSAYRKLVLRHHPDLSNDPASKNIFLAVTEAYDVLSDPAQKTGYDRQLAEQAVRVTQARQHIPPPSSRREANRSAADIPRRKPDPAATTPKAQPDPSLAEEIQKLTKLFQSGRQNEAEIKARAILKRDARQPVPYAVLGDIAKGRGNLNEAAKMYAYAMQMDPRNSLYERRYNEVLARSQVVIDKRQARLEPEDQRILAPLCGSAIVLVCAIYLVVSQEQAIFRWLPPISTWTLGALVTPFCAGVTVGASLALGNLLERFGEISVTSTGKIAPTMALGCVSIVQFWFAAFLYGCVGLIQRGWNLSTTRLVLSVGAATILMAAAAGLSVGVNGVQMLLWGGNVIYLGALCGWMVADAVRP